MLAIAGVVYVRLWNEPNKDDEDLGECSVSGFETGVHGTEYSQQ
jgi:hypothetical protein